MHYNHKDTFVSTVPSNDDVLVVIGTTNAAPRMGVPARTGPSFHTSSPVKKFNQGGIPMWKITDSHVFDTSDEFSLLIWNKVVAIVHYLTGVCVLSGKPMHKEMEYLFAKYICRFLSTHFLYRNTNDAVDFARQLLNLVASTAIQVLIKVEDFGSIDVKRGASLGGFDNGINSVWTRIGYEESVRIRDKMTRTMDLVVESLTGNNTFSIELDKSLSDLLPQFTRLFNDMPVLVYSTSNTTNVSTSIGTSSGAAYSQAFEHAQNRNISSTILDEMAISHKRNKDNGAMDIVGNERTDAILAIMGGYGISTADEGEFGNRRGKRYSFEVSQCTTFATAIVESITTKVPAFFTEEGVHFVVVHEQSPIVQGELEKHMVDVTLPEQLFSALKDTEKYQTLSEISPTLYNKFTSVDTKSVYIVGFGLVCKTPMTLCSRLHNNMKVDGKVLRDLLVNTSPKLVEETPTAIAVTPEEMAKNKKLASFGVYKIDDVTNTQPMVLPGMEELIPDTSDDYQTTRFYDILCISSRRWLATVAFPPELLATSLPPRYNPSMIHKTTIDQHAKVNMMTMVSGTQGTQTIIDSIIKASLDKGDDDNVFSGLSYDSAEVTIILMFLRATSLKNDVLTVNDIAVREPSVENRPSSASVPASVPVRTSESTYKSRVASSSAATSLFISEDDDNSGK